MKVASGRNGRATARRRRATAAIASTLARPSAVSICGITIVRSCSAAIFATTSPRLVVVVREAEGGAAASRAADSACRTRCAAASSAVPDHRHHHPHRADVECAGDERIFAAGHPHHRHDAEPAAERELLLRASRTRGPCAPCRRARSRRPRCGRSAAARARKIRRPSRRTRDPPAASVRLTGIVADHDVVRGRRDRQGGRAACIGGTLEMPDNRAIAANVRCARRARVNASARRQRDRTIVTDLFTPHTPAAPLAERLRPKRSPR